MALTVLDASVVISMLDDADALHRAAVEAIASADDQLVLPASAFAEMMVNPQRHGRAAEVRQALDAIGLIVEPLTEAMADRAAALRAGHASMRLGDALVLGAAEVLGADRVLTSDARWPAWDGRVVLVRAGSATTEQRQ